MLKKIPIFLLFFLLGSCRGRETLTAQDLALVNTEVALAMAGTQTEEAVQAEATRLAATETPSATSTAMPSDTATLTLTPSPLPTETFTLQPTFTETPTETPTVTPIGYIPDDAIFFYATILGTGGKIGCGDDLIKLYSGHVRTGDLAQDLALALNTLFSSGGYPLGFYNATYPSNLQVQRVDVYGDGSVEVHLDGNYVTPKDSCDASRYRSQVWATGLQFDEVVRFIPFVGNKLLGDRLAVFSDSGQ
jgi:hypothetical protein